MSRVAQFFHWCGHPFRVCGRVFAALINLTQTQIRALFSIGMLGGIVALSLQNIGLIVMVRNVLGEASPGSLFGNMALNQQFWNNSIIGGFGLILGLVVWGADYLKAKYSDTEISAGKREESTNDIEISEGQQLERGDPSGGDTFA